MDLNREFSEEKEKWLKYFSKKCLILLENMDKGNEN